MSDVPLDTLYRHRFSPSELPAKRRIWEVLCRHYFQPLIGRDDAVVLDLACGYGEFINQIVAARKLAVDLNPDSPSFLQPGIEFHPCASNAMTSIADASVDVVFTSNFFEHLPDKAVLAETLDEIRRVLAPGGRLIAMGPNIRLVPGAYWDFIDHHLPLSERSLCEALGIAGLEPTKVVAHFLPYSTRSSLPQSPFLVRAYLLFPLAWRILGKQFLVVARKSAGSTKAEAR
jgi:SAM-dependent methyltransferase